MQPVYNNPLPDGWHEEPLNAISTRKRGYSWEKEQETPRNEPGTTPVIRIPNIQDRLILDDLLYLRNVPDEALRQSAVSKDWILFVGSNGNPDRIGDSALMTEDRPMVFASFLMGITPKDPAELLPEFMALWMRFHNVHETFSKTSQQTTGLANLSWSAVKRLPLRFPGDASEQRAIADIFQVVDASLRSSEEELNATDRLKASLMQRLFSTGLVGKHTEMCDSPIGPIPATWTVRRVQDVLAERPFSGVSPPSRSTPPGTPILNVTCISDGECEPSQVTYVDVDEQTAAACRAKCGDFYVLRGNGNREYVGTGGLLRSEPDPPAIFSDKLIRLRFKKEAVADGYMPLLWQSHGFLRRLQSKAESGSGLWMMSKREIRREIFGYPPKEEQEEIVSTIAAVDHQRSTLSGRISALRQLERSLSQHLLAGKVRIIAGVTV